MCLYFIFFFYAYKQCICLRVCVCVCVCVCSFQLPREEHNTVGIHTVISVLRLASSEYVAVQLAKPEQASQACTTCLHSVARENTKDNVNHKTASSKCRFHRICYFFAESVYQIQKLVNVTILFGS